MRPIKSIPLNVESEPNDEASSQASEKQSEDASVGNGFVFHVTSPNNVRHKMRFQQFPITVGKSVGNDITIDDPSIDGLHLKIWTDDDKLVVESFGSQFTYNGQSVRRCNIELSDSAELKLGSSQIMIAGGTKENFAAPPESDEASDDDATKISRKKDEDEYTVSRMLGTEGYDQGALKFYRRLSVLPDVKEMSKAVLTKIAEISGGVESSALYLWQQENRSLKCFAAVNYLEKDREGIDRDLFLQLKRVNRPIKLHSSAAALKEPSQTRLIVPMMLDSGVFGFAYMRIRQSPSNVSDVLIAKFFDVLRIAAPIMSNAMMQKQMDAWLQGMVETILATIGAKDTYTVGHSERVCRFSVILGRELGLTSDELNKLMFSSLIHDIGKVGIPDAILKKADLLSTEEFEIMRQHPVIGGNMIAHMPMADQIIGGVKHHHERWDGTGYPDGLEGEAIPLFGRIVAVTDAFDAMTSGRSYSGYMSVEEAITRLADMDDLFDKQVLEAFVKAYNGGELSIRTGTALNERISRLANRLVKSS